MPTSHAELLRNVEIFGDLSDTELESLAEALIERHVPAGAIIVNQGDAGDSMYIVADGQVNVYLPGEESHRVSLSDLGRGEHFGELALFDGQPRSASAVASTDVELLELPSAALRTYLERTPTAALPLLHTMAERLRQTNSLLSERATKNAISDFEKSLTWSARLADRVAEFNGSWTFIVGLVGLTIVWILVNLPGPLLSAPFDGFPFVFFNLVLAIMVALQGPLILMSQNRQGSKDRAKSDVDFNVNLKNEVNIETILRELGEFRHEALLRIEELERKVGMDEAGRHQNGAQSEDRKRPSSGVASAVAAHRLQQARGSASVPPEER